MTLGINIKNRILSILILNIMTLATGVVMSSVIYVECRIFFVIMPSVITLSVVMLSVVAPFVTLPNHKVDEKKFYNFVYRSIRLLDRSSTLSR
jgi:hypothetical protein